MDLRIRCSCLIICKPIRFGYIFASGMSSNIFYRALKFNRLIRNHRIKFLGLTLLHLLRRRHLVVNLDPTLHCNLRCRMCHFSDPAQAANWKGLLKKDELDRIAEMIYPLTLKLQIGCAAEPTVHKDFVGIIRQAKQSGVPHVALTTNANLLNTGKMKAMIEAGLDEVIISLHGTTKQVYEYFMDRASYERFSEIMQELQRLKNEMNSHTPRIRINYTVNRDNLDDLTGLFTLFDKIDIAVLQVRLIQNLGDTAYADFNLADRQSDLERILSDLAIECKNRNTTFLKPNIGQLSEDEAINDASLIYQATCRYISPKIFWEKGFDWKNESYHAYCKKIGWTKYLLGNVLKSRKKIESYNHLLNYDVLS